MFDKMPHRKSSSDDGGGTTTLRRSPRFLLVNSAESLKFKSRKSQQSVTPISASDKAYSSPPLRAIESVSLKKKEKKNFGDHNEDISGNFVGSIGGSRSSGKTSNGSTESANNINRVDGFQGLRRSPRFSNKENACEDIGEKRPKIVGEDEMRRREDCAVISPVRTPQQSGYNKRRIGSRGIKEVVFNGKLQQCEENLGVQEVKKMCYNTRSRCPLSSLENTSPTAKDLVGGLEKSMEPFNSSAKSIGKIEVGEKLSGPRRSSRLFNLMDELLINEKSSQKKPYVLKGENAEASSGLLGDFLNKPTILEAIHEGKSEKERSNLPGKMNSIEGKSELGFDSSKERTMKMVGGRSLSSSVISKVMMTNGSREKSLRNINSVIGGIEDEQKSNQSKGNVGHQGWSEEQELALQRAYFAAKPSPHFWKKVSKLVPGKSAQECFDKVHSSFPTPPHRPPRSRAKRTNSSPLGDVSLSGSKLLEPTDLGTKRKRNKVKKGQMLKTARHLLQKHSLKDQNYEADLFSIFEPSTNSSLPAPFPSEKMFSTPDCTYKNRSVHQECHEKLQSTNKKPHSRFKNSGRTPLASPPILKPIKNMKMHEKYIDQLHRRETRRMAGRKCRVDDKDGKLNEVQRIGMVKAAKKTLVSDAREMINQLKHLEANAMNDFVDSDDDCDVGSGKDEGEEEL